MRQACHLEHTRPQPTSNVSAENEAMPLPPGVDLQATQFEGKTVLKANAMTAAKKSVVKFLQSKGIDQFTEGYFKQVPMTIHWPI